MLRWKRTTLLKGSGIKFKCCAILVLRATFNQEISVDPVRKFKNDINFLKLYNTDYYLPQCRCQLVGKC